MNFDKFEFYNADFKVRFLKNFAEGSQLTYAYVLSKTTDTEKILNKDLYNFTLEEFEGVMYNFKLKTLQAARINVGVLSNYVDFAMRQGMLDSNIGNVLEVVDDEWLSKFIKKRKLFISESELIEIENRLVNYQDQLILRLPFEGIMGKDLSEMRSLNRNSVNLEDNKVLLKDEKSGDRYIEISDRCKDMIFKGLAEEEYQKLNGESQAKAPSVYLRDNGYVLRSGGDRRTGNGEIALLTLYNRLSTIKELFPELESVTIKNLQKSGMIKMAVDIYKETGDITNDDLTAISDKFNTFKLVVNGGLYCNYKGMREFINRENILELYGIDINK